MEYKSLNEQLDEVIMILSKNKKLMDVLDYVCSLKLNNFYIAAGSVFQTIWNYYDKKDLNYNVKDIDVIYFNDKDMSVDTDIKYYNLISKYCNSKGYDFEIDVSNEARMHLWKKEKFNIDVSPYKCSEDAIEKWIATVHAIGVTKENGKLKIYAPYGLSDIFSRTIRPIKHEYSSRKIYEDKAKSWSNRFDGLNIIKW